MAWYKNYIQPSSVKTLQNECDRLNDKYFKNCFVKLRPSRWYGHSVVFMDIYGRDGQVHGQKDIVDGTASDCVIDLWRMDSLGDFERDSKQYNPHSPECQHNRKNSCYRPWDI